MEAKPIEIKDDKGFSKTINAAKNYIGVRTTCYQNL